MKKILKSVTFWFVIMAIFTIVYNILGYDDLNLIIGVSDPIIFYRLVYVKSIRDIIWNDGPNVYLYILHFIIYFLCGAIIDFILYKYRNKRKHQSSL